MSEPTSPQPHPVRQLRLVVETEDFDAALAFYRDVLGLPEKEAYEGADDARVVILSAGMATLELSNPAQVRLIDRVEADGQPSARLRVAFEVDDTAATTDRLVSAGAVLTATPRETPWRSINSRMDAPAGLQVTLFQELDAKDPAPAPADGTSDPTPDGASDRTPDGTSGRTLDGGSERTPDGKAEPPATGPRLS